MLMLEDGANAGNFARDTEAFYYPKVTNVEVTIEVVLDQFYSKGMRAYKQWDEAKFLAVDSKQCTNGQTV